MNPEPTSAPSNSNAAATAASQFFDALPTPAPVTAALQKHLEQIKQAAGDTLVCMALYGGILRGRYQPQWSDINLLLVLNTVTGENLGALAPLLHAAWREILLEPFLLAQSELARAAVVFPTKMLDIRGHHQLVAGRDVFSGLEIKREDISLRVEQELRNLAMRLRRRFLAIEQDEQALQRVLLETAVPLRVAFLALFDLAGAEVASEERTATVYATAANRFQLDRAALERLAGLRDSGTGNGQARDLYLAIMQVVGQAAETVAAIGRAP
jgi:hypothetical protein